MAPRRSVVLGYWQDRPPLEALDTARCADDLGFDELTIAAFGPRAMEVAAAHADRAVLNLVTPEATARIRSELERATEARNRKRPRLAVWLAAAVDPTAEAVEQLRRAIVAYLAAPG